MGSRVNYGQERAKKTRAREAKKEEKLRRREEASVKRKALSEETQPAGQNGETGGDGR